MKTRRHVRWTEDELRALRDLYPTTAMRELRDVLRNRTSGAILGMASALGLRKAEQETMVGPEEDAQ